MVISSSVRRIWMTRGYAERAVDGKSVQVGAADEDGRGAAGESLVDVGAAADAAIHNDGHATGDGRGHGRERVYGGGDRVQAPAAVIGNDDPINAAIDGADGVGGI